MNAGLPATRSSQIYVNEMLHFFLSLVFLKWNWQFEVGQNPSSMACTARSGTFD